MKNEKILKEWMEFAEMDFLTAKHLYEHMYPKPLEIICYHCQQNNRKQSGKIKNCHAKACFHDGFASFFTQMKYFF